MNRRVSPHPRPLPGLWSPRLLLVCLALAACRGSGEQESREVAIAPAPVVDAAASAQPPPGLEPAIEYRVVVDAVIVPVTTGQAELAELPGARLEWAPEVTSSHHWLRLRHPPSMQVRVQPEPLLHTQARFEVVLVDDLGVAAHLLALPAGVEFIPTVRRMIEFTFSANRPVRRPVRRIGGHTSEPVTRASDEHGVRFELHEVTLDPEHAIGIMVNVPAYAGSAAIDRALATLAVEPGAHSPMVTVTAGGRHAELVLDGPVATLRFRRREVALAIERLPTIVRRHAGLRFEHDSAFAAVAGGTAEAPSINLLRGTVSIGIQTSTTRSPASYEGEYAKREAGRSSHPGTLEIAGAPRTAAILHRRGVYAAHAAFELAGRAVAVTVRWFDADAEIGKAAAAQVYRTLATAASDDGIAEP